MTRRILFVNHTGELGGAEMTLLPIASRYRTDCVVALLKDGPVRGRLEALGVSVTVIDGAASMLGVSRQAGMLRAVAAAPEVTATVWRLAKLARKFDVLYANSQKAAVIAFLAGAMLRKPVIWYLHDILSPEHFAGMQRRTVVTLANRLARSVITNSTASADAFVACGGDRRLVSVAPSGVDPAAFDQVTQSEIASVRPELGIGSAPLIGLFGRLAPWKGQHVLLEALARLDGVHGMIVGGPLFGEEHYRDRIVAQSQKLGIANRIHWLGFRDDIPRLMRATDVIAHCSVSPEPFGRVIVEGMLARRPVVASDHGASTELLGDRYPYLVPAGDPGLLAGAIDRIQRAPPHELVALVGANYARACERFSTDRMFDTIDRALAA